MFLLFRVCATTELVPRYAALSDIDRWACVGALPSWVSSTLDSSVLDAAFDGCGQRHGELVGNLTSYHSVVVSGYRIVLRYLSWCTLMIHMACLDRGGYVRHIP